MPLNRYHPTMRGVYGQPLRSRFLLHSASTHGVSWWVSKSPSQPEAITLTSLIHALRWSLSGWALQGLFNVALVVPLFHRIGLIGRQIEGLQARLAAGTLRRVVGRGLVASGVSDVPARARPVTVLPRGSGWLVRAAAWRAAVFGAQLQLVLEAPDMVALLTAAPQAARILRPLCRMLLVDTRLLRPGVPVAVVPPKTPRPVKARVRTSRAVPQIGRIPWPRGVIAAARRAGFGKVPRD